MDFTVKARNILNAASYKALELRHEFVTPEHVVVGLINDETFIRSLYYCEIDYNTFVTRLEKFMNSLEKVPEGLKYELVVSEQANEMITWAEDQAADAGVDMVDVPHIVEAILHLRDSEAKYLFVSNTKQSAAEIVTNVLQAYEEDSDIEDEVFEGDAEDAEMPIAGQSQSWHNLVTCVNDSLSQHNPLIGREEELQRTVQVLCRKEKNNPLHVGEPGVGKTALVYGLAQMIEERRVPERLLGHRIYSMDMGTMLAGTQFRGEFEKRIKQVMEGARKEGNAIIYIDE